MDRLKVEDNKDLERDTKSNAIVNTNTKALDVARKRQADAQKERDKLIVLIKLWGGKVIEIPYTKNISSTEIKKKFITN